MDDKLVVKNIDGNDLTIDVVDIIEDKETNENFICYTIGDLSEVFVSKLIESETGYSLDKVTEEEQKNIEAVMNNNIEK